jgi:hypothetical protein
MPKTVPPGTIMIPGVDGRSVFSRSVAPDDSRSDAASHGGFAGDRLTMTSVMMRILGRDMPAPENDYQPNAAVRDAADLPAFGQAPAAARPERPVATEPVPAQQATVAAETHEPGERPLVETAEPRTTRPTAPGQPSIPDRGGRRAALRQPNPRRAARPRWHLVERQ